MGLVEGLGMNDGVGESGLSVVIVKDDDGDNDDDDDGYK